MIHIQDIRSRLNQQLLVRALPLVLVVYPYWFMHEVLAFTTQKRLGNSPSDMNLTIRDIQFMKHMNFPWSWNYRDNFPYGIKYLRIEHIVDSQFKFYCWILTRIFEPTFIANFYIFLGMIATGSVAYLLTRHFNCSVPFATAAGLLAEALPWIRQNALFGVAGTWYPVAPLIVVLLLLKFGNLPNWRHLGALVLGVAYAIATSAYAFFFSLFVIVVWILFNVAKLRSVWYSKSKTFRWLGAATFLLFISTFFLILKFLLQFTRSESGGAFTAYSIPEVMTNIITFKGFVTPDHFHYFLPTNYWEIEGDYQNYAGIVVVALFMFGAFRVFSSKTEKESKTLYIIALFLVVMTLGNFVIGSITIPSARIYIRHVMPGIRQFSRASLIAEVIMVVGAVLATERLSRRIRNNFIKYFVIVALLLTAFIDLNPTSRRFVWDYAERFQEIRDVLAETPTSGLFLATPIESIYRNDKNGRSWDYLDAPIFTDFLKAYPQAARGESEFASYLNHHQVGYVLARVNDLGMPFFSGFIQDAARFTTLLTPPRFTQAARDVTLENRDDYGNLINAWKVRLLKVVPQDDDQYCAECLDLGQFSTVPQLEVKFPEVDRYLNDIDWSVNAEQIYSFDILRDPSNDIPMDERIWVNVHFELVTLDQTSDKPLVVRITSPLINEVIQIPKEGVKISFRVPISDKMKITSDSECSIPNYSPSTMGSLANREICYGIRSFWIELSKK